MNVFFKLGQMHGVFIRDPSSVYSIHIYSIFCQIRGRSMGFLARCAADGSAVSDRDPNWPNECYIQTRHPKKGLIQELSKPFRIVSCGEWEQMRSVSSDAKEPTRPILAWHQHCVSHPPLPQHDGSCRNRGRACLTTPCSANHQREVHARTEAE